MGKYTVHQVVDMGFGKNREEKIMLTRKSFLARTALLLAITAVTSAILTSTASAIDVYTEPVGFTKVSAPPNADTVTSVPFTRMPEYQTSVGSVSGSIITATNSPGWAVGKWVFPATSAVDNTVSNTYYVVMTSGAKNGAYYTITNSTANQLDVQLIAGLDDLSGIVAGDKFKIIPYWTLGTVWPQGQGVVVSAATGLGSRRTQVLFPPMNGIGINLAPTATFFCLGPSGSPTNWVNASGFADSSSQIILPDQYIIVRQPSTVSVTTTNTTLGQVALQNFRTALYGLNGGQQDSFVALPRPSAYSLYDLGFTNNNNGNGFLASVGTSLGQRRDTVLVYAYPPTAQNAAPIATYYLLGSSSQWRSSTDSATDVSTNILFQPGQGFIVRKSTTNVTSTIWSQPPNYSN